MNNEKAVVNSDDIITSFGNKMKNVDEQFNTITIYPEFFGAKGDGLTDDTLAIQKAIDSLPFGGTLTFLDKVYVCANVILKSNIKLIGKNTTLKLVDNAYTKSINGSKADDQGNYSGNIIGTTLNHDGGEWYNPERAKNENNNEYIVENVEIRGIIFDGNKSNNVLGDVGQNGSSMGACVNICQAKNIRVENCKLFNARLDGLYVGHSLHGGSDYCTFKNLEIHDNGRCGIAQVTGKYNTFDNCKCYNNHSAGIDIEPNLNDEVNYRHTVINCDIEYLNIVSRQGSKIYDNKIISNTIKGTLTINSADATGGTIISNNTFLGDNNTLLKIRGSHFEDVSKVKTIKFSNNIAAGYCKILEKPETGALGYLDFTNNDITSKEGIELFLPKSVLIANNTITIKNKEYLTNIFNIEFHHSDKVVLQGDVCIKENIIKGDKVNSIVKILSGINPPTFYDYPVEIISNNIYCESDMYTIEAAFKYYLYNNIIKNAKKFNLIDDISINKNEIYATTENWLFSTTASARNINLISNILHNCVINLDRPQKANISNNTLINGFIRVTVSFTSVGVGRNVVNNNTFMNDTTDYAIKFEVGNSFNQEHYLENDIIANNIALGTYQKALNVAPGLKTLVTVLNNNFTLD